MRQHGREIVGVDKIKGAVLHCAHCQHDRTTIDTLGLKYAPEASVCDAQDPAFALCEVCWFVWDAEQSGLRRSLIRAGVSAFKVGAGGAHFGRAPRVLAVQIREALAAGMS